MDTQTTPPEAQPGASSAAPGSEAPKRRGRPFGSRNKQPPLTETPLSAPPDGATPVPGAEPQKRRGRKAQVDTAALAKHLEGIHKLAAMATGQPVLLLHPQEAELLANAMAGISREYNIDFDGRVAATIQLAGVAAMIYIPRFQKLQEAKRRNTPVTVEGEASGNDKSGNGLDSAAATGH